jgi:hypothetical protein
MTWLLWLGSSVDNVTARSRRLRDRDAGVLGPLEERVDPSPEFPTEREQAHQEEDLAGDGHDDDGGQPGGLGRPPKGTAIATWRPTILEDRRTRPVASSARD